MNTKRSLISKAVTLAMTSGLLLHTNAFAQLPDVLSCRLCEWTKQRVCPCTSRLVGNMFRGNWYKSEMVASKV